MSESSTPCTTKEDLSTFFSFLLETEKVFSRLVGFYPTKLVVNPEILRVLSKIDGFYQRPEINAEVLMYAPVLRYIKLRYSIVTIQEDYEETFMHFEV